MHWITAIILTLQLAQSDGVTPTVHLSQEAWAGYQFYLLSMGSGSGTFAVSPDGIAWGFSYCSTWDCPHDNTAIALHKCEEHTDFTCLVFARDSKIEVDYVLP